MLRDVFQQLLSGGISRRQFLSRLAQLGVGAMAASQLADVFAAVPESERDIVLNNVTGGRITCETLKLWGVKYVFGNTGAYEAGFVDALVDFEDIHYVLGLHEGSVMAMADGYARITGQASFVNIASAVEKTSGSLQKRTSSKPFRNSLQNCRFARVAARISASHFVVRSDSLQCCRPARCSWVYRPMSGPVRCNKHH
jgi:hypothetical protein